MTENKTSLGVYAHQLMGLASFISGSVLVFGVLYTLGASTSSELFTKPLGIIVSPFRWHEVPVALFAVLNLWVEVLNESPGLFGALVVLPNIVILACASVGTIPAFPLIFRLKDELINCYARNEGFTAITEAIDKLESRGQFVGGVREQGMLRMKLAYTAEKMAGLKVGAATTIYLLFLRVVAVFTALSWVW